MVLGEWQDASAIILSCPGPLRRHRSAVLPTAGLDLPQVLLGSESQLLAFAAQAGAGRLFFTPFPEMFPGAGSLAAALAKAGGNAGPGAVHLRFGSVRAARILKGVRNACVLAECRTPPPLTASHHPFASGQVLPAAVSRTFLLCQDAIRPVRIGGGTLPATELPDSLVGVGLPPEAEPPRSKGSEAGSGLEVTSLAQFRSAAWAAGGQRMVPAWPEDGHGAVLLPWNMDHPGSIVPELLERLARLHTRRAPTPRIMLMPFNYIGQTGIIRDLVKRVAAASEPHGALLPLLFLARVRSLTGVAALRRLSRVAWVDGNDPEHWWTLGRLAGCGIATILLATPANQADGLAPAARFAADETMWVEANTRCGTLVCQAVLPSLRRLPLLLGLTADTETAWPPDAAPSPKRRRRAAAIA